jgi:acyl-coenzyme A thioesterase PaaI-like protein
MTPELIARVRRHFGDGCFACGSANRMGLQMDDFQLLDGKVQARFHPKPEHGGAFTTLHGGIAAAALDEVMVWAGILNQEVLTVTGSIEIRFRRPLTVADYISATGWIEQRSGRRLTMAAELTVDGQKMVEGRGLYVVSHTIEDLLRS